MVSSHKIMLGCGGKPQVRIAGPRLEVPSMTSVLQGPRRFPAATPSLQKGYLITGQETCQTWITGCWPPVGARVEGCLPFLSSLTKLIRLNRGFVYRCLYYFVCMRFSVNPCKSDYFNWNVLIRIGQSLNQDYANIFRQDSTLKSLQTQQKCLEHVTSWKAENNNSGKFENT